MLNLIVSGVAAALKVAAPIFIPPLMAKLEKKLPATGDGPKRRESVMRAVGALASSLMDDGVLSAKECEELRYHVAATIETFLPAVEAEMAVVSGQRLVVSGSYLDVGGRAA